MRLQKMSPRTTIPRIALAAMLFSFVMGLTAPAVVSAGCASPAISFGRWKWCGYWYNGFQDYGTSVRDNGIPSSVNTASEFINMVLGDLVSGDAHRMTEAKFVIRVMDGQPLPAPRPLGSLQSPPTATSDPIVLDWKDRITKGYATSENGSVSSGPNGTITWFLNRHTTCGTWNTYYQTNLNDIAPFVDSTSNSSCGDSSVIDQFVVFKSAAGKEQFVLRRLCMNPMGPISSLSPKPANNYNLKPTITTTVGGQPVNGGVEIGQTIHFDYGINNSGTDTSPSANCNIYKNVFTGYVVPGSPSTSGGAGPATGCPKTFGPGTTRLTSEDVPVTVDNQTICRSLVVRPSSATVAQAAKESCVPVIRRPYARVFGGDVSVGGGLATAPGTCTTTSNNDAAVIGWNKRAAGGFAGAGVQYAVYALNTIEDMASSLGSGGAAIAPAGLSFANTSTNLANGDFGGSFGSAPCIPDYYATMPSSTKSIASTVVAMADGNYAGVGNVTFTGTPINPHNKISVYVDGNAYISGNITYVGSWSVSDTPMFRLIVRGNIYIDSNVSQLDGLYVAQPNGASGGTIYTCTDAAAPFAQMALSGKLASKCGATKLTVNGGFAAKQVLLMRTKGTLNQSSAAENAGSANLAEVFNFNPALWISQPVTTGTGTTYDTINSLPPVL